MSIRFEERYYPNGQLYSRSYYLGGRLHRKDGPAFELFYNNGALHFYEWRLNGKLHHLDGPAQGTFNENGSCASIAYCIDDKSFSKTEFQRHIVLLKLSASTTSDREVLL